MCELQFERTQATTNHFHRLVQLQPWHVLKNVCVPQHQMLRQLIQRYRKSICAVVKYK